MISERPQFQPRPKDFHFEIKRNENGTVSLFDGADQYTFMLRNGKPFVISRPGERDISKEKWRAMMQQAGAILGEL